MQQDCHPAYAEKDGTVWVHDLITGNRAFEQKIPGVSSVYLKEGLLVVGTAKGDIEIWSVTGPLLLRKIEERWDKMIHVEAEKGKVFALSTNGSSQKVHCFTF